LATRSHGSLANTERQRQVRFKGALSLPSSFLLVVLLHLIFILIKYSLFCHGKHRLSLATRSYHCLAITERQQWIYFEGKFSESSPFSVKFFKTSNYFQ
jgi:hypothetical protein